VIEVLSAYDGQSGVLVDTNVWIDCLDAHSAWHEWSIDQLQAASETGALHVNQVIYAELLVPGPAPKLVDELLAVYNIQRSNLPWSAAALAAQAFARYRKRGGPRTKPLPDFYIGAHAAVGNLSLLTRDVSGYRSHFPKLRLLTPA
jgi:predicted nucleic acid-binding protein